MSIMAVMVHGESKDPTSGTSVIGLGRFDPAVAVTFDKLGYEILAVERDPAQVRTFAGRFPLVEADTTLADVLEQLGVRGFKAAVAGAGSSSESPIPIATNLANLGMPSTWTKAISREHGRILCRIGAYHVIYSEFDAGQRTAHLVGGRMIDYIEMEKGGFAIMKLRPPGEVHGFTLEDLDLWGRYGVNTLGILRLGQPFKYVKAQTCINSEDIITVFGDVRLLEYFANHP